jgi:cation transport ATPase
MQVNYVELRNRNLVILSEKIYDVSLVEKDDVIRVQPGTLLVDVIVISGQAKVTQSARTGSD